MAKLPNLVEAEAWFKDECVPKRTASAGFSGNRLWKTPQSLFRGNAEDADGLCGDAALFCCEEYYRKFDDYSTSDGFIIGMVLWEGVFLNHIANVMLVSKKAVHETYTFHKDTKMVSCRKPVATYGTAELLRLRVFDLYYKKACSLREWWHDLDALGGRITIGQQADFA